MEGECGTQKGGTTARGLIPLGLVGCCVPKSVCGNDSRRLVQIPIKTHSVFTNHLFDSLSSGKKTSPTILVPRLREILQYCAKWTMLACNILVRRLSPQVVSGVVRQPEMASHSPPGLHSRVTRHWGTPALSRSCLWATACSCPPETA